MYFLNANELTAPFRRTFRRTISTLLVEQCSRTCIVFERSYSLEQLRIPQGPAAILAFLETQLTRRSETRFTRKRQNAKHRQPRANDTKCILMHPSDPSPPTPETSFYSPVSSVHSPLFANLFRTDPRPSFFFPRSPSRNSPPQRRATSAAAVSPLVSRRRTSARFSRWTSLGGPAFETKTGRESVCRGNVRRAAATRSVEHRLTSNELVALLASTGTRGRLEETREAVPVGRTVNTEDPQKTLKENIVERRRREDGGRCESGNRFGPFCLYPRLRLRFHD